MDVSCMSLEDIIKNKKFKRPSASNAKPAAGKAGIAKASGPGLAARKVAPKRVTDARDIICTKTRKKIVDARDRLNELMRQTDARERLRKRARDVKRLAPSNGSSGIRRNSTPAAAVTRGPQQWSARPITSYMDVDDGIDLTESSSAERLYIPSKRQLSAHRLSPQAIKRTVHNEVFSLPTTMPPLPRFRTVRTVTETPGPTHNPVSAVNLPWSDPFKTYERLRRPHLHGPPVPLPNALMAYEPSSMSARQPRGILRKTSRSPPPMNDAIDHPQLSSSMRARLERAPNPSESMGIFAKMPTDSHSYTPQYKPALPKTSSSAVVYRGQPAAPPSPPATGYRIVVSNLHSKVIHQDIQELFGDIGDLIEARLVRPGVAEVIYRTLKDAEKAVDVYHNRQLDGQPMNCLLVHPRASNKPTAPAMSIKYATR